MNPPAAGRDDGLPDWLRQLQPGQASTAQPAYPNGAGHSAPQHYPQPQPFGGPPQQFAAGNLVNDDALPDWLRSGAETATPPQAPYSAQPQPSWNAGSAAAGAGWNTGAPANGYGSGLPAQPAQGQAMGFEAGQPSPLTSGPLGYNQPAGGLFDEAALPDWLREASRGQAAEPPPQPARYPQPSPSPYGPGAAALPPSTNGLGGGYGAYPQPPMPPQQQPFGQPAAPAQPPSSAFPSLDQAGMRQPPTAAEAGLSGRALLDTGNLPNWLGGHPGPVEQPGGAGVGSSMTAQSLIDETALPQWLRAEPNAPTAPATPGPAAVPPPPVSSRIAASASAEPLPAWLNQVYTDNNVARIAPQSPPPTWGMYPANAAPAPASAPRPSTASAGGGAGMSASEFVDESALPEWLRSQGAIETPAAAAPNAPFGGEPATERVAPRYVPTADTWNASLGSGGSGQLPTDHAAGAEAGGQFAASDLIDPTALPGWVRGAEAPAAPTFSSTSGWTSRQPAAPASASHHARAPQETPAAWNAGAAEWETGGGSGALDAQAFRDDGYNQWSPQRDETTDDGAEGWYSSGPQAPFREQPMAAPNGRGQGPRFGERAPNTDRRRGPPIPSEDLPPWLQRGGDPRDMHGMPGNQPRVSGAPGGYGPAQGGRPMGPATGYDDGSWGGAPQNGAQPWSNWDDGQYGGAGYGEAYADYPRPESDQQGRQRGGWRRLFGRK